MKERSRSKSTQKRTRELSLPIIIPLILVSLFVIIATAYKITDIVLSIDNRPSTTSSFPKLELYLKDVPLEQINFDPKGLEYPGNTIVLSDYGKVITYEDVEIKGRGNANWNQLKKPYQIKLTEETSLMGLKTSRKWALVANYIDRSYLRTDFAYYLERLLSEDYALNGSFVELFVDNSYLGLYYISEKIEAGPSHINLQDKNGVIVELDNLHAFEEDCYYTAGQNCITPHDAADKHHLSSATEDLAHNLSQVESLAKQRNFNGIANLIDVDSFAKYYLLSEFTINPDAYSSSFFFYRDGKEDKIHAGPGWDFDFSLANTLWTSDGLDRDYYFSPFTDVALKDYHFSYDGDLPHHAKSISTILYDLMDVPEFKTRVKEIYQETISGKKDDLLNYIRNQANYIKDAAIRDQERWKLKNDFEEEINYLIDWVSKRYDHFEETYGKNAQEITEAPAEPISLENPEQSTEV